jgi:hypothetical protein
MISAAFASALPVRLAYFRSIVAGSCPHRFATAAGDMPASSKSVSWVPRRTVQPQIGTAELPDERLSGNSHDSTLSAFGIN